jgi:hypothetical protein
LFYNIEAKPRKPDMEMALRWYGIWHEYVGVDMKRNSTPHFWRSFLKICLEHCRLFDFIWRISYELAYSEYMSKFLPSHKKRDVMRLFGSM